MQKKHRFNKINYLLHKADYNSIIEELSKVDWREELGSKDVETQWVIFNNIINYAKEKHVPKRVYIGQHKQTNTPIDRKCIEKIQSKHNLWKKYMKNRNDEVYSQYCKVRNQVKSMLKRARKNYEKDTRNIKENPKIAWKYIKSKYKVKDGIYNLKYDPSDNDSRLTTTDAEKAEV